MCGLTLKGHNGDVFIGGWGAMAAMLGSPDWVRSFIFYKIEGGGTPLMERDSDTWETVGVANAGTAGGAVGR